MEEQATPALAYMRIPMERIADLKNAFCLTLKVVDFITGPCTVQHSTINQLTETILLQERILHPTSKEIGT
ncbi:hypothetical protein AC249_AIPGENE9652 [Exaiptasia diaphana]|nr:hypothetical protein AC249_AIPGENE9652 [Exaiptasia diaphana]